MRSNKDQDQNIYYQFGIAVALAIVVGIMVFKTIFVPWQQERKKQQEFKRKSEETCLILNRFKIGDPLPLDAWGNETKLVKRSDIWDEEFIISAGADGKFDTIDDLEEIVSSKLRTDYLGEKVGEKGTDFGIGVLRGTKNALKKVWSDDGETKPEESED